MERRWHIFLIILEVVFDSIVIDKLLSLAARKVQVFEKPSIPPAIDKLNHTIL